MNGIEKLRERLHHLMDCGDDSDILVASQELDTLIVLYMKLQLSVNKNYVF